MDPAPETLRSAAGVHLIGDLCNCASRATFWHDAEALRLHCLERVRQAGLTATGSYFHALETGGVTGVVVLAESHLAIHTWPEPSYVTLDVFVCNYSRDNTEKADQLFTAITDLFQPESPVRQVVFRGAA